MFEDSVPLFDKREQYLRRAENAEAYAARADDLEEKRNWLRLAESWRNLIAFYESGLERDAFSVGANLAQETRESEIPFVTEKKLARTQEKPAPKAGTKSAVPAKAD
jgi:hypothetical protein